ncbi:hypothetical protein [Chondrinema litorale]|uniref:hypothetical protein n=1 Tax=Chondrinema litorale TaxID=2994555 RepID=UPI0025436FB3|nr:hypothetical protein [Chondrinema litorale]UZS00281.1 hypothetical protein OQ292_40785 [Chondrinema litorale]
MINIDDRLYDLVDNDEFWVLNMLARRINKDRKCFPSRRSLETQTKLSRERLAKALTGLKAKNLITWWQENKKGNFGKTIYKITTPFISVYVPANQYEIEIDRDTDYRNTGMRNTQNREPDNRNTQNRITEVLSNKEVLIKESINKKEVLVGENKFSNTNTRKQNFKKPSEEEVKKHFIEKGLSEEKAKDLAFRFWNHYECVDWYVGKKKMSRWRNSAALWMNSNENNSNSKTYQNGTSRKHPLQSESRNDTSHIDYSKGFLG